MTGGYSPGTGPGPKKPTDEELSRLLGEHRFGALATNKSNGHPALSTVLYHWDPQERVLRFSTTADRLKVRHVRNDPRVALYVTSADHMTYVVAEGVAEASPVSERPGDGTGRELLAIYPAELSRADQAVFLENMVKDRRLVVRIRVTRLYGLTVGG